MRKIFLLIAAVSVMSGIHTFYPESANSDNKPVTSSLGNPKVKFVKELVLPSVIKKIIFSRDKDNHYQISKIHTYDGLYDVKDDYKISLSNISNGKEQSINGMNLMSISRDGNYGVEFIMQDDESSILNIVDLKTGARSKIKGNVTGEPKFSDNTLMFVDGMANSTCFVDLNGQILNAYQGLDASITGLAHKFGFFSSEPVRFYDVNGKILKSIASIRQPEFRVNYETGDIALYYHEHNKTGAIKNSMVGIYNWKGELQHEMRLDFAPNTDMGFSPDGRFVVLGSTIGWVKLIDMKNEQLLWSKEIKIARVMYWHKPFPINDGAKIFAFYAFDTITNKPFIMVFNFLGEVIDKIEIDWKSEMEEFRCEFIPGSNDLLIFSGKYLDIYRIEE